MRPPEASRRDDHRIHRVLPKRVERAALQHPPRVEHRDLVGERLGIRDVVGDEDRGSGEAAEHVRDRRAQRRPQLRVDRGERLVEQQQHRSPDHRAHERDPRGLTTGHLRRPAVGEAVEALLREGGERLLAGISPCGAAGPQPERHVVEHREVREQRRLLLHQADRPAFRGHEPAVGVVEHHAVEHDGSARQRRDAGERREGGGLARTVPPHDGEHRPGSHRQRRVEREAAALHAEVRLEGAAHGRSPVSHRSRSVTSTATATSTSTTAIAIAEPGSSVSAM